MIKRFTLAEIKAGLNEVNNDRAKGSANSIEISPFDRSRFYILGKFLDHNGEKKSCIIANLSTPLFDEKDKNGFPIRERIEAKTKEISAAKIISLPWRSYKVF